ncbi:uncharacterized protein LOC113311972 [Papaver somniferum]|uniref:uncharacterized protein LOC113311972 n=1 Tax=Papaver somniferum TaxID=3469 RepID=UPI000E6F93D1|nr:uncharacterized protein LOC113311972 [Papaver somniferum]
MPYPKNLKEFQKLNGSLAALGRFIARSSDKCKHFFNILKKGTPLEAVLKSAGKVRRIAKWNTHLDQFNIVHEIQTSQKSQVLADFLEDLPLDNDEEVKDIPEAEEDGKDPVDVLEPSSQRRWEVFVDGSRNREGAGIVIIITTPTEDRIVHALRLEFKKRPQTCGCLSIYIVYVKESVKAIKITRVYEPSITPQQAFATNREDDVGIADDDVGEYIVDDFIEDDILSRANEDEEFKNEEDWRTKVHLFLEEGTLPADLKKTLKVQSKSGRYYLRDRVLYKKSFLGPLLRCLSREVGHRILKDIHYEDAGNHRGMRSLAEKAKMQGLGIPAEIVSDNGKQLQGKNIDMLFDTFNIRKNKSTLIYPQSNGRVEATNKTLSLILKKSLDKYKGRWCEQLQNVLWAYRTTRRSATGESPFFLTYGAEEVIPTEIIMPTTKTEAWEKNLTMDMILERLDDLEERRETALQRMENYQRRLAREYNKKVKLRNFVEGHKEVLHLREEYQKKKTTYPLDMFLSLDEE